ncbi:MAG: hypothetical protein ACO3RV_02025 [Luteolibacter sp.]
MDYLAAARTVIEIEMDGLNRMAKSLDASFVEAVAAMKEAV